MLSELKKIEKAPIEYKSDYYELHRNPMEFRSLGDTLDQNNQRQTLFDFRGRILKVQGIPEDFRVMLQDDTTTDLFHLVCEIVYGSAHNENQELVDLILGSQNT